MEQLPLIPHLFRTEYSKITAVLSKLFGMDHLDIAQDIASETFALAAETWPYKGVPTNPTAWLYKVAKNKADQVEIPKGVQPESRKKRDEEDLSFVKKEAAKPAPVVEPVVEAPPVVVEAKPEIVVLPEEPEKLVPLPVEEPIFEVAAPLVDNAPVPEVVAASATEKTEEPTNSLKIESPELEGPKILGKVDLSAIDSSTRPKKGAKKPATTTKASAKETKKEPVKAKVAATPTPPIVPVAPVAPIPVPPVVIEAPVISNIKADKLEGPKILGKIVLPVESDTRPKPLSQQEKRKRKRIPVKGEQAQKDPQARAGQPGTPGTPSQSTGPNNRFGPRSSELPGAQNRAATGGGPGRACRPRS